MATDYKKESDKCENTFSDIREKRQVVKEVELNKE